MSEIIHKIRVKIGDVEIEVVGPEDYVNSKYEELKEEILNLGVSPPIRSADVPTPRSLPRMELPDNLPTLLTMKGNPKGYQDITLVFAEWLLIKENIEPFNKTDISNCYKLTRITPSKNITQDLIRLQSKGLLNPDEKEGGLAYRLSQPGMDYLEKMG